MSPRPSMETAVADASAADGGLDFCDCQSHLSSKAKHEGLSVVPQRLTLLATLAVLALACVNSNNSSSQQQQHGVVLHGSGGGGDHSLGNGMSFGAASGGSGSPKKGYGPGGGKGGGPFGGGGYGNSNNNTGNGKNMGRCDYGRVPCTSDANCWMCSSGAPMPNNCKCCMGYPYPQDGQCQKVCDRKVSPDLKILTGWSQLAAKFGGYPDKAK